MDKWIRLRSYSIWFFPDKRHNGELWSSMFLKHWLTPFDSPHGSHFWLPPLSYGWNIPVSGGKPYSLKQIKDLSRDSWCKSTCYETFSEYVPPNHYFSARIQSDKMSTRHTKIESEHAWVNRMIGRFHNSRELIPPSLLDHIAFS